MDIRTMLLREVVVPMAVAAISAILTEKNYQRCGDLVIDFFERVIERSDNNLDDRLLLPIVRALRVVANIPDMDDCEPAKSEFVHILNPTHGVDR